MHDRAYFHLPKAHSTHQTAFSLCSLEFTFMDVQFLLLLVCLCTLSSVLALQREASTIDTALVEFVRQRRSHGSYSQEESVQEGLFTNHHSERIHMQSSTNGMSMHSRRLLSLGNRQILATKAQGDKGEPTNLEKGTSVDTTLLDNLTNNKVKSGPSPSSPVTAKDEQPRAGKEVNNSSHNISDDQVTLPDTKANTPAIHCGESLCEVPKAMVSACLRTPGDGAHKLSLFIVNAGDSQVLVNVIAPEYLVADPRNVSVPKGKSETIQFLLDSKYELSILDSKAVNKNITVVTANGNCEIAAPLEYLRSSVPERKPQFSSYLPSVTPRVVAYLGALVLVVALVGAWFCYKCCGKKRAGDVKYQQLEMIVPGQSTPKERDELRTEGWDDVWDDDWEDAEAAKSSSCLSQNLSSRGLGARRGNKDGWDNSWDD